jgi:hypothetical protein
MTTFLPSTCSFIHFILRNLGSERGRTLGSKSTQTVAPRAQKATADCGSADYFSQIRHPKPFVAGKLFTSSGAFLFRQWLKECCEEIRFYLGRFAQLSCFLIDCDEISASFQRQAGFLIAASVEKMGSP